MRQILAVASIAIVIGLAGIQAAVEDTKTARGAVRATAPDAVTIQVGSNEVIFKVDSATKVMTRGGSKVMQDARAVGKTSVPYTEVVKVGQMVELVYHEAGMHAAMIRVVTGAPRPSKAAAASADPTPRSLNHTGVVTAVSDTSFTIRAETGDMTYAVDGHTKIFGSGLGTQARAMKRAGERTVFSQFVHEGDDVQVRYQEPGGTRHASEVHVTRKGN